MKNNDNYESKQQITKQILKRPCDIEKPFKGYNRAERRTKAYKLAVIEGIKTKPGR